MNFTQRFGLFILILISIAYVYFSFFKDGIKSPNYNQEQADTYNPMVNFSQEDKNEEKLEKRVSSSSGSSTFVTTRTRQSPETGIASIISGISSASKPHS